MAAGKDDMLGALVGWTGQRTGDRIVVSLQTVSKPPPHEHGDVDRHSLVLTANQAVQLGNYLFEMSGQTPPRRTKKGLLDRMLGG